MLCEDCILRGILTTMRIVASAFLWQSVIRPCAGALFLGAVLRFFFSTLKEGSRIDKLRLRILAKAKLRACTEPDQCQMVGQLIGACD